MADVLITLKIMPDGTDMDFVKLEQDVSEKVLNFDATVAQTSIEPVAFGIKALKVIIAYDEKKGTSDELEEEIAALKGVQGVEVVDVRRAFG